MFLGRSGFKDEHTIERDYIVTETTAIVLN